MADHVLTRWLLPLGLAATIVATPALNASAPGPAARQADEATIRHVLNRVTFGPKPGDVARVGRLGLDRYLDEQLYPERIDDSVLEARLADLPTLRMSTRELTAEYFAPALEARRQQVAAAAGRPMVDPDAATARPRRPEQAQAAQGPRLVANELMQAKVLRALSSERQLQEVLTDFWFNHFNVFIGKNVVRPYVTAYERDTIRPHVFGSFRDLLGAVAKSPAMLTYLDNWQSAAPVDVDPGVADIERRLRDSRLPPAARQRLTERLMQLRQRPRPSRGLNENYARELLELHTLGVDGGYTQDDVVALARILTGWTVELPRQGGGFQFRAAMHDTGTKTLLGRTFAGTGQFEGEAALDLLAEHPATAKHIATKLAQRFVADDPPAAVIDRAATVFLDTKGDLREVVRSILTSPEFHSDTARRAKVKTPLEFVASAARATDAVVTNAQPMVAALQSLGMPLYGCQAPTGYATEASAWVNTGALLGRMNFAVELMAEPRATQPRPAQNRQAGGPVGRQVRVDVAALAPDTSPDTQAKLIADLLGGVASEATRQTLARAESPAQLIALTLGSPEFQRR